MRNLNQIAGKPRLKGGGEAGAPDRKSLAQGSCAHSTLVFAVHGPSDLPATSCSAASDACRSAGYWQASRRAST